MGEPTEIVDESAPKGRIIDKGSNGPRTLSVPEAGRWLGIGRNAAYDAARRGEIPTIRIGRLLRVPVVALQRKLEQAE